MCGSDIFLGIVAILFPPIAVWVKRGICSGDSFINIALCCLGILPGLLHAWYIISVYPEPTYDQVAQEDPEGGRVTYYYVQQGQGAPPAGAQQGNRSYGTVAPPQQGGSQQYRQEDAMGGGGSAKPDGVPPTYAEAVKGDHKVQSHA